MNKVLFSIGALAVGAATLNAQTAASGLTTMEKSKPWSVSASVRGFYDDNYVSQSGSFKRDSFGFTVSPSASINLPLDQTFIGLSYVYAMTWFEDRSNNSADHSHQVNAKFDHAFSERYKLELSESFNLAQEPELLNQGVITIPVRTEGSNMRNTASADFRAQVTQLLGLDFGYENTFWDFEQTGPGSRSALLDRIEHLARLDARWHALPKTIAIVGYQFGVTEYTSNDALGLLFGIIPFGDPSMRDNRTHYGYLGIDQNLNSQLNASIRLGAMYTDYYNSGTDAVNPYADLYLTYTYAPGSYVQAGVKHQRAATDISSVQDQEVTVLYGSINHRLTSRITAQALAQLQRSEFGDAVAFFGTTIPGEVEWIFLGGINLAYQINPHWTADVGYNFDNLESDVAGRSFTRNRVYVGLRATY